MTGLGQVQDSNGRDLKLTGQDKILSRQARTATGQKRKLEGQDKIYGVQDTVLTGQDKILSRQARTGQNFNSSKQDDNSSESILIEQDLILIRWFKNN